MSHHQLSRRGFLSGASTLAASAAAAGLIPCLAKAEKIDSSKDAAQWTFSRLPLPAISPVDPEKTLDLAPAQWVWYPAKRILPNSFFHFRKAFEARKGIRSAKGWMVGDSRYVLFCNGRRIQFGPAPSDPRFTEADPVDLSSFLQKGSNAIGATVLYYGFGDGTWPAGKAGFIFKMDVTFEDGTSEQVVSDSSWMVQLARSWTPGMYKRWYLRSLQERYDNRL
ncbi:MAG TPA: alpha-L-rhamnosidase N-terminal domain-containing protein, partial [Flavisolibacter sp.]|nr:alpha-L-rhamnosidase N-terminal domain-containing protein [Flavisolibacter sp.]